MASRNKSAPELINELKTLVIDYAKQETVDPLRSLGRYLGYGIAGSLLLAIGGLFFTVGLLRLLQTETGGAFDGGWSFVPYLFVLLFSVVVLALLGAAVLRTKKNVMEQP
ncbi:MAG: phage holin family protein [Acidimicrobiales bacterium]|nr:phage holin family protein [Acidimicrobiales bacterium]